VSIERGRRQLAPNRRGRIQERKQAQIQNYQDGREMTDSTGPDGTPAELTESRTEPGERVLTGLKNSGFRRRQNKGHSSGREEKQQQPPG
jgi:hypothetical protein